MAIDGFFGKDPYVYTPAVGKSNTNPAPLVVKTSTFGFSGI